MVNPNEKGSLVEAEKYKVWLLQQFKNPKFAAKAAIGFFEESAYSSLYVDSSPSEFFIPEHNLMCHVAVTSFHLNQVTINVSFTPEEKLVDKEYRLGPDFEQIITAETIEMEGEDLLFRLNQFSIMCSDEGFVVKNSYNVVEFRYNVKTGQFNLNSNIMTANLKLWKTYIDEHHNVKPHIHRAISQTWNQRNQQNLKMFLEANDSPAHIMEPVLKSFAQVMKLPRSLSLVVIVTDSLMN